MPIFIRGSGGGSSAKLEGDRYVSPSTSGAVKVTPNSGYDGFKDVYVYGFNKYNVSGSDATDDDVVSGYTYYSDAYSDSDSIRTGGMPTIAFPAPAVTAELNDSGTVVIINSSYKTSGGGYSNSSAKKTAAITIDIPQAQINGAIYQTGYVSCQGYTTVAGNKLQYTDAFPNSISGKTLKWWSLSATNTSSYTGGDEFITCAYCDETSGNGGGVKSITNSSVSSMWTDVAYAKTPMTYTQSMIYAGRAKYCLAKTYRYFALYN